MSNTEVQALDSLLQYISGEQEERCRRIMEEAEADAAQVLREARHRSRQLVRRAVAAERIRRARSRRKIRAEVQMRMRRTWFRLIRRELDQAWPALAAAIVAHWQASADNRRQWLRATMDLAAHSLGPGLWHVTHPEDWQAPEGDSVFREYQDKDEALTIHCRPESQLAGFRISCGDVSVATTVDGLFARKSRIEGYWLALLQREGVLTLPTSTGDADD